MMFLVEATALRRSSLRAGPNHRALGPDPHLQLLLLDVDPLHQDLDGARPLGGEQLAPDRGEVENQALQKRGHLRGSESSREQGACTSCCCQMAKLNSWSHRLAFFRKPGRCTRTTQKRWVGGCLHHHPALQVVHHLGA
jgi:hypothetical protein